MIGIRCKWLPTLYCCHDCVVMNDKMIKYLYWMVRGILLAWYEWSKIIQIIIKINSDGLTYLQIWEEWRSVIGVAGIRRRSDGGAVGSKEDSDTEDQVSGTSTNWNLCSVQHCVMWGLWCNIRGPFTWWFIPHLVIKCTECSVERYQTLKHNNTSVSGRPPWPNSVL